MGRGGLWGRFSWQVGQHETTQVLKEITCPGLPPDLVEGPIPSQDLVKPWGRQNSTHV